MAAARVPVTKDDFDRLKDSIDRWRVSIQARQDEHHNFLYGNGKPGIDEDIRSIKAFIQDLKEQKAAETKERRDSQLHYLRLTVGTALSAVVVLIINGVVWFAKILPLLEKMTP